MIEIEIQKNYKLSLTDPPSETTLQPFIVTKQ